MYYWMLRSIYDLCPLGARSKLLPLPLAVRIKSLSRHCQMQFCLQMKTIDVDQTSFILIHITIYKHTYL